jgi:3-oxoacyl-[acyl-carrier-protein] synthase II
MSESPVAVTGIGAVSGFGWGVDVLWRGLRAGEAAVRGFDRFDHAGHRTHIAAQVPAAGNGDRTLSWCDHFALGAAAEAVAGAALPENLGRLASGVFFSSSTGGMFEAENFFSGVRGGERGRIGTLRSQQTSGPGEAVARRFGVRGPVETISSACASAALAIGSALDALRAGEVDLALAGGADSLCRLTYAGFNSLRSVDSAACRPFRAGRQGLSLGEGGAVLVLERLDRALARGARPLAILAGAGASCDAHHMTAPDPSGSGVARALRRALDDARTAPAEIAFVNAHGTGTPLNDAAEWQALVRVFGERAGAVPVTSTKGAIGHLLGSAGAIEAVATLLCLRAGEVHPTPGGGEVDGECPADLVMGRPRPVPGARAALSANFAFGGSNAALVFHHAERFAA